MIIKIGHKVKKAKIIESDLNGKPIGGIVLCPYCNNKLWFNVNDTYKSIDGSTNNIKCKHCLRFSPKLYLYNEKQLLLKTFTPKNVGWHKFNIQLS